MAQAGQLHNLRVVHKEIDVNAKLTDIPGKPSQ